jgi:hypothetical protein
MQENLTREKIKLYNVTISISSIAPDDGRMLELRLQENYLQYRVKNYVISLNALLNAPDYTTTKESVEQGAAMYKFYNSRK